MKLKILYLILSILIFIPIGLCEKIDDIKELNNIKIYDEKNKIINIYDKNNIKSMDIKLISTISDIDKLIKIIKVTNYIEYIPNKENDFITKTKKVYGKNDIYKVKYFIEKYNYTFDYIIINETIFNNKTGKNEIKLINKTIIKNINSFWVEFKPYNKKILENETFKLKIIHYKKPELGFFKIQTIPIFKKIECKEFTWWHGNWNLKRVILINNTYGDNVTNYTLKSVNLSEYEINASSTRIINETSGLIQSHWNESIDSNGNLEYVWCNFSKINNNSWINSTYYIYYQSEPNVNSISNGNTTFELYHNGDIITTHQSFKTFGSGYALLIRSLNPNCVGVSKYLAGWGDKITMSNWIFYRSVTSPNDWAKEEYDGAATTTYLGLSPDTDYHIWDIGKITDTAYYHRDGNDDGILSTNAIEIANKVVNYHSDTIIDWYSVRKYIINEPELWIVGNIEYPEALNMTCNIKIITHLTEKEVQFVNMTGDIVNTSKTNVCVNLSYDSYIVYMANPIEISSFTNLFSIIDNVFIQLFLFTLMIVIAIIFITFLQIIKKKGFKGVTK